MKPSEEKISEAISILEQLGVYDPSFSQQRKRRMALTLLAVGNVIPNSKWQDIRYWGDKGNVSWSSTTREIIKFWNEHYGLNISSGSYDDVRRKNLDYLVQARLVDRSVQNPDANTNNPTRSYALNESAGLLLRSFGTSVWERSKNSFIRKFGKLEGKLERPRTIKKVKVILPDTSTLTLLDGEHNRIQKAVIEEFLTRFLKSPKLLYCGDANNKFLFVDEKALSALSIPSPSHDKLPDIIAFDEKRKWIFFIEAVHSSNPVSRIRHLELASIAEKCIYGVVYVSAFASRKSFRNWIMDISWETEAWIAESPDHLIHFDGDRFLGPYD